MRVMGGRVYIGSYLQQSMCCNCRYRKIIDSIHFYREWVGVCMMVVMFFLNDVV